MKVGCSDEGGKGRFQQDFHFLVEVKDNRKWVTQRFHDEDKEKHELANFFLVFGQNCDGYLP